MKRKGTTTYAFYISVRTDGCSVALTSQKGPQSPRVVVSTHEIHTADTARDHRGLVAMKQRVSELIDQLRSQHRVAVYTVVFLVHAPLATTRIIEHTYTFASPTVLSEDVFPEILASVRSGHHVHYTNAPELVRESIASIAEWGEPRARAKKKPVKSCTATIVHEYVTPALLKAFILPIARGSTDVSIHHYAHMVGDMIAHTQKHDDRFAVCEVGAHELEVYVYDKATITEEVTLPHGSIAFDAAAGASKRPRFSLAGLAKAHVQGMAHHMVQGHFTTAMERMVTDLQAAAAQTDLTKDTFPRDLYIISEAEFAPFWFTIVKAVFESDAMVVPQISLDPAHITYTQQQSLELLLGIYAHSTVKNLTTKATITI